MPSTGPLLEFTTHFQETYREISWWEGRPGERVRGGEFIGLV